MANVRLREHRGTLSDSLATVIDIEPTHAAVTSHVRRILEPYGLIVAESAVGIAPYEGSYGASFDENTHIVTVEGYGVFGFTDGPVAS